jgi:hypothetical protein
MYDSKFSVPVGTSLPEKPAILAFGWNTWSDYWMPRQQYLSRFGERGWPVAYTSGNSFIWQLMAKLCGDHPRLLAGFRTTSNIRVYEPGLLCPRWPGQPRFDRFALWNEVRQLKKVVNAASRKTLAFITHPLFAPYLDHLEGIPVVYFAEDAFSLMPGWSKEDDQNEVALVQRADLIVTCAPSMA